MTAELPARYKPPEIDTNLDARYRRGLKRVRRWEPDGKRISDILETDLEHVDGMIDIVDEIAKQCPNLASVIALEVVKKIIYVHDAGELLIGDEAAAGSNYQDGYKDRKDAERDAIIKLTDRYVADQELRDKIWETYIRYDNCRPTEGKGLDDKEALLTHLIDKLQAARFGMVNVFQPGASFKKGSHFSGMFSLEKILEFTVPLLDALPEDARVELFDFVTNDIQRFRENGFPEIADLGLQALRAYKLKPRE